MKILKKFSYAALCVATALLAACSSNDPEPEPEPEKGGGHENVDPDATVHGQMTDANLSGFVTDTDGLPIEGVSVTSGTHSTVTDAAGSFTISKADVNNGRSVVAFAKEGYFSLTRSVPFNTDDDWTVALCPRHKDGLSISTSISSDKPTTVEVGGLRNTFPADGFKNRATGEPYKGTVKLDMVYLNPNAETFAEMMPGGDLAATDSSNERVQLISYGMTAVNLSDEKGNALQIADGKQAELTFPIPEGMEIDAPAEMPLWSFNEATGLWEQEGVARKVGNHYVGSVTHFSWVNLDYPEREATVKGRVTDDNGVPAANTLVRVGQISARTNAEGYFSHQVPAKTAFKVGVKSEDYGYYSPEVWEQVEPLEPLSVKTVNIVLPALRLCSIFGTLVEDGKPVDAAVWLTVNGIDFKPAHTSAGGKFEIKASRDIKGKATLHALSKNGVTRTFDVELNGSDIDMGTLELNDYDNPITPPGMDSQAAKAYIEETANMAIAMFNPEDQRRQVALCGYFNRTYADYDAPAEWGLENSEPSQLRFMKALGKAISNRNYAALGRAAAQTWTASMFNGVYKPFEEGDSRYWAKTADSNDCIFRFPYQGDSCEIKAVHSGGTWAFAVNDQPVAFPEQVDITVSVGSDIYMSASLNSNYNMVAHTVRMDASATVANITALATLRGNDRELEANAKVNVGGNEFITANATVTGADMLNPSELNKVSVLDQWGDMVPNLEQLAHLFHTVNTTSAIINNRIALLGQCNDLGKLFTTEFDDFSSDEFENKELARQACQEVCDIFNRWLTNSITIGGQSGTATIQLRPTYCEESYGPYVDWWWEMEPLIIFADNSSYAFQEYFGGMGFESAQGQLQNLINLYKNIWEGL